MFLNSKKPNNPSCQHSSSETQKEGAFKLEKMRGRNDSSFVKGEKNLTTKRIFLTEKYFNSVSSHSVQLFKTYHRNFYVPFKFYGNQWIFRLRKGSTLEGQGGIHKNQRKGVRGVDKPKIGMNSKDRIGWILDVDVIIPLSVS